MADKPKVAGAGTIDPDKFVKADPSKNPRNQAAAEIWAKRAAQADEEAKETMPTDDASEEFEPAPKDTDVDGTPLKAEGSPELEIPKFGETPKETKPESETDEAPAQAAPDTPSEEAEEGVEQIEADSTYEITVDGKKMEVEGAKLIEAGIRTYQKEAAADVKLALANERLQTASRLLEEAQQRHGAPSQGTPTPGEPKKGPEQDADVARDVEWAKAIQFGTEEQAAKALQELRASGRAVTPEQINQFVSQSVPMMVRQELALNDARQYAATEFSDIMEKPLLKSLFDAMEMQARQNGDQTPPRELYAKIGEVIRTQLGMDKPKAKSAEPTTLEQRKEAKKAAPTMPKTAVARLEEGAGPKKPPTASDIIAAMASRRGQGSLTLKPQ